IAESSVTVVVANASTPAKPKPASSISILLKGLGQQVSGTVHLEGAVAGGTPNRVEFWVDGHWRWTERSAPYEYDWDTAHEQAGPHVVSVKALSSSGLLYDIQTLTTTVQ